MLPGKDGLFLHQAPAFLTSDCQIYLLALSHAAATDIAADNI